MAIDPKDLAIHDQVVLETEIEGEVAAIPAFVTNVLADELWLATKTTDARLAFVTPGQRIHLSFDRGGALVVESRFLRRLGDTAKLGMEKSRVFAVERPTEIETVQRRAHVRVDVERSVRIKALGTSGGDKIGAGRTINIGAGGVLFITDTPLLFGEQLRIALVLTARDIVVATGAVVRIEDHEPASTPGAGPTVSRVAVRFDKISEADQERITCHILAVHRAKGAASREAESRAAAAVGEPPESEPSGPAVEKAALSEAGATAEPVEASGGPGGPEEAAN